MAITDGLISYWTMNDADYSAPTLDDVHGANDATNSGATTGGAGILGQCFDFNTNDILTVAHNANLYPDAGKCSISMWMKRDGGLGANRILMTKGVDFGYSAYAIMILDNNTIRWQQADSGTTDWVTLIASSNTITDANWHHIVVTNDGSNADIWIDGVKRGTDSTPTPSTYETAVTLKIGGGGTGFYFEGRIDEVGFWNRGLTDGEIASLYNSGAGLAYPLTTGPDYTKLQINIGDVWKAGAGMQINIGDAWKQVAGLQINIGDVWKTIF